MAYHLLCSPDYREKYALDRYRAVFLFSVPVTVVGTLAGYRCGELLVSTFDYWIVSVPSIEMVYCMFRQVVTMIVDDTGSEFETVKLLDLLSKKVYVIAFQMNPSSDSVGQAIGDEEMVMLFVPMAPNPVIGVPRVRPL